MELRKDVILDVLQFLHENWKRPQLTKRKTDLHLFMLKVCMENYNEQCTLSLLITIFTQKLSINLHFAR